jgi:AraC family transcriptional regulator
MLISDIRTESRRRDIEPSAHNLGAAKWHGFEAIIMRTDAGMHYRAPADVHRLGFHTGAAVRADCWIEGATRDGWQCRGNFDLLPAGASGAWCDETDAELLSLRISPALLESTAEALGLRAARLDPRLRERDPHVEHIAWALKAEVETDMPAPRIYGDSLGVALASRLLQRFSTPRPNRISGLTTRQLRQVVDFVEANIDQELSLADLAGAAGISVSHFTAMFRRAMGQSAHRYVVERRVLRAQDMLARRRASISEVAAATGFAHPSHLARWMRRTLGVTPSELARAR